MLRKSFRLTKPVAQARVYASGLAYDDLSINGTPTSDAVLDPGFTDYSRTVLYTTRDVTALLHPGRERDRVGTWVRPLRRRGADLGLGMGRGAVARDAHGCGSTSTSASPTEPSSSSDRTPHGKSAPPVRPATTATTWARPTTRGGRSRAGVQSGYDDSSWAAARTVSAPAGVMRAQTHEPIQVVSRRPPGDAIGARTGRVRLRHRPEPDRLGRDRRSRSRGHADRDLLLREARSGRHGRASSATISSSASCRPTTTWPKARRTRNGRLASATRDFSTSS